MCVCVHPTLEKISIRIDLVLYYFYDYFYNKPLQHLIRNHLSAIRNPNNRRCKLFENSLQMGFCKPLE